MAMITYHAVWVDTGTNEEMRASAPTREALNLLIYGRAYSPKRASVMVWTTEEKA